MKFEMPQISAFNITLITLLVSGGIFVSLFYPTESRIEKKWEKKMIHLNAQIEELRIKRTLHTQTYLEEDRTMSGAIVAMKLEYAKYAQCKNDLSFGCKKKLTLVPEAMAEEINIIGTDTSASSEVPLGPGNKRVQVTEECELGERDGKVEGIEFHYTASPEDSTLSAIKTSHENKYGIDHIGYHYVIKPNGEVTRTRAEKCIAAADKWEKNNYRFIQVAFIGDDKPTEAQTKSMVELAKAIQFRYKLSIDSVSSHQEWGPKSVKENFIHWYGSKENFIKKIRETQTITIYGKDISALSYAWYAWGDIDFIATIWQESRFDGGAIGDGGDAKGFCQINAAQNPGWAAEYKAIRSWQERLNYCHEKYTYAAGLPGGVGSRFHGYNVRMKHVPFISIR